MANCLALDDVRRVIEEAVHLQHFFVADSISLECQHEPEEELFWELFQGHLLDGSQTRRRRSFEAWNILRSDAAGRSLEPVLSVKLDVAAGALHVTRAVLCHAWEAYSGEGNLILSRESVKSIRELVGSIDLAEFPDIRALRTELTGLLFRAVIGYSRLPLTSVEAPLPGFTLGELGYFHEGSGEDTVPEPGPMRSPDQLIRRGLHRETSWLEKAKLLELLLRAAPTEELAGIVEKFVDRWQVTGHRVCQLQELLRTLFEEVALSPYTDFVDKVLLLLRHLEDRALLSGADVADFLSYLLRHIVQHLTAYDLVTFHHRGANYPDALLLDAALKSYIDGIERHPALFLDAGGSDAELKRQRLRRRALRQAWLLRRRYEGHRVPDAPTSPGENLRVLPPPFFQVPEEQILDPSKRRRRLFDNDPLDLYLTDRARAVLQQSVRDLEHPPELRELGMALFLDRPLGVFKPRGERDHTLLLSYDSFSRSVAEERLRYLAETLGLIENQQQYATLRHRLEAELEVEGIPPAAGLAPPRPGVVSLDDARMVAPDFIFLRTTCRAVRDFLEQYDLTPLAGRCSLDYFNPERSVLILRGAMPGRLAVYDAQFRKRLELEVNPGAGYATRGGREYPRAGLRVLRVWDTVTETDGVREQNLEAENLVILPRRGG